MRLLGVIDEDPFDFRTWSGSSAYFFLAMKRAGLLAGAVSAQPSRFVERIYQLRNLDCDINRWKFKYHLDPNLAEIRTRIAIERMAPYRDIADCYLQIGAMFNFTGLDKPVISYHDGNLARRLDSPYGYPKVSAKVIDKAMRYEHSLYQGIDRIFTMSQWLANSFITDFGVSPDKVAPIYAGINMPDVEEFSPAAYAAKNLLFVGKQFERKGGRVLLDAFQKVRRRVNGATLTIVGPVLDELPEGVVNPGFVSKSTSDGLAAVKQLYRDASVFVLPTLYEPFGISFVEAMAHGLPCVGTRICAVPEIVAEGESGYLVEPNDPDALAERLIELLMDADLAERFGRQGFKIYREQFRWEVVAGRLLEAVSGKRGLLAS